MSRIYAPALDAEALGLLAAYAANFRDDFNRTLSLYDEAVEPTTSAGRRSDAPRRGRSPPLRRFHDADRA